MSNTATKAPATLAVTTRPQVNITRDQAKREQVARFKELKAIISAAQKELGDKKHPALEAEISDWMTGADDAIVNGVVVLKRSSERNTTSCDFETLLTVFPEAYDGTVKKTFYTYFTAS